MSARKKKLVILSFLLFLSNSWLGGSGE